MFEFYSVCIMTVWLLARFEKQVLKRLGIIVNTAFYWEGTFKIHKYLKRKNITEPS